METITSQASSRTIFGLMAAAMLFSIIGAEITLSNPPKGQGVNVGKALSSPFLILLGGTAATAILVLVAEAGEVGRKFGVGMAGLAATTAILVNGGPVWTALNNLLGSKPTVPSGLTSPTVATGATEALPVAVASAA